MRVLYQGQSSEPLVFLLVDSSLHIAGKTSVVPTVTISKNGGSFTTPAGTVTEMSNGWYKVAPNATDCDTLGPLILHAEGTGADPTDEVWQIVAVNPRSASYGLSLAKTTNITGFNDIASTSIVSAGAITTSAGAVSTVTGVSNAVTVGAYSASQDPGTYLTNQGYTTGRAPYLDRLDTTISSRASSGDVMTAMTAQGYTTGRATKLDYLDAAVSSIYAGSGISSGDVKTAMTSQGYTTARATLLDYLDVAISTRSTLSSGGVQVAMTAQGYNTARSVKIDNLDAAVTTRLATGPVTIDLTQVLSDSQSAGTVGRALQLARASAKGNWVVDPGTDQLKMYDTTGTLVATFTLAPAGGPWSSRTIADEP
jgi:hypothetical protein